MIEYSNNNTYVTISNENITRELFQNDNEIIKVIIDSDVISVENNAFQNFSSLEEVIIKETVETFGSDVFSDYSITIISNEAK